MMKGMTGAPQAVPAPPNLIQLRTIANVQTSFFPPRSLPHAPIASHNQGPRPPQPLHMSLALQDCTSPLRRNVNHVRAHQKVASKY